MNLRDMTVIKLLCVLCALKSSQGECEQRRVSGRTISFFFLHEIKRADEGTRLARAALLTAKCRKTQALCRKVKAFIGTMCSLSPFCETKTDLETHYSE